MSIRQAAVEGRFYPSTRNSIFKQIEEIEQSYRYPEPDLSPSKVYGAVLPHAGHMYSGYQTIPFFQLLQKQLFFPETYVIVHPNHSGLGSSLAIDDSTAWSNHIGDVPIDREMASAMDMPFDSIAHAREHSAEVIIPFLQYYQPDQAFSIVPVCMKDQSYQSAKRVANGIKHAAALYQRKIMVLASCDFSHFQSPEKGAEMDDRVLGNILERNVAGVEHTVSEHRVSVCGFGPIMTLMEYAQSEDKAYKIKVLARGHSGEVHPSQEVVDYISILAYS